jgi:hypothetical protein
MIFKDYEEIKEELNRILLYECRCDERLKVKVGIKEIVLEG